MIIGVKRIKGASGERKLEQTKIYEVFFNNKQTNLSKSIVLYKVKEKKKKTAFEREEYRTRMNIYSVTRINTFLIKIISN